MVIRHKHRNISGVEDDVNPVEPTETMGSLQEKMDELQDEISAGVKAHKSNKELNVMRRRWNELYERWAKMRFGS